jgi:hypothetical protein
MDFMRMGSIVRWWLGNISANPYSFQFQSAILQTLSRQLKILFGGKICHHYADEIDFMLIFDSFGH